MHKISIFVIMNQHLFLLSLSLTWVTITFDAVTVMKKLNHSEVLKYFCILNQVR